MYPRTQQILVFVQLRGFQQWVNGIIYTFVILKIFQNTNCTFFTTHTATFVFSVFLNGILLKSIITMCQRYAHQDISALWATLENADGSNWMSKVSYVQHKFFEILDCIHFWTLGIHKFFPVSVFYKYFLKIYYVMYHSCIRICPKKIKF